MVFMHVMKMMILILMMMIDEDYYVGYKFNFLADGSITAKNHLYNYSGTWSASGTGNNIVVHIDIPNLPECNNKWILHEMNLKSGEIEFNLYLNNKKLRFGSSCSSDPLSDNLLTQTLINNNWKISHYFNNTNQTSVFSDYTISFSSERGIITSSNPTGDHSGYWNTSTGDHYDLELNINFLNTHNLNELTEDWDVVSVTNTTIKLRDLSREDGTEDLLTLQRI